MTSLQREQIHDHDLSPRQLNDRLLKGEKLHQFLTLVLAIVVGVTGCQSHSH